MATRERHHKVAAMQTALHRQQPQANRDQLEQQLAEVAGQADLMVLPEMFNRGVSVEVAGVETMDGPKMTWLRRLAAGLGAAICSSIAIHEAAAVYNRFVWVTPDGALHSYDKRRMGSEQRLFSWRGWRTCPLGCYDLRFPVWSRNRGARDLLIHVANWPTARRQHWRHLLLARAIENQCAVAGVNRVGTDGQGIHYSGDSLAIDARGEVLADAGSTAAIHLARLRLDALHQYRAEFPVALGAGPSTLLG